MKRFKFLIAITLIIALFSVFMFSACAQDTISAPSGYDIDIDNTLTWESVAGARTYTIQVKRADTGEVVVEEETRRLSYSLSSLEEGDYEVRVKCSTGGKNNVSSDWSEVINFHRDHETGLIYSLINNGTEYEITRIGSASGEVEVEDEYRGRPVTSLGAGAFRSNISLVTKVKLGKYVTRIGENAFNNCTRLTEVSMPDGVTTIGSAAFQGCSSLTTVNIPASLTVIPDHMFAYCSSLKSVTIPDGVTYIDTSAFYSCTSLESVEIPDSVTAVGEAAFQRATGATSLKIGSGVTAVAQDAFRGMNSLSEVTFAAIDHELTIASSAFQECAALTFIALPENTVSIGSSCFRDCTALASVDLPETLSSVGVNAFINTGLYTAQSETGYIYADNWLVDVMPEQQVTVTSITADTLRGGTVGIADQAFIEQTSLGFVGALLLESVTLPDSVKYIGAYSFYSAPVLYRFTALGLRYIGEYAFCNDENLSNVQFRDLKKIDDYAFRGCQSLNNNVSNALYITPAGLEYIGRGAFNNTALWNTSESAVVKAGTWIVGFNTEKSDASSATVNASGVTGIAEYALFNQQNITTIQGLGNIRHLNTGSLSGTGLASVTSLSEDLTEIEDFVFYNCGALRSITLPRRLRRIGEFAFFGCVSLGSIDLGRTQVTEIATRSFAYCQALTQVTFNDELTSIGTRAFYSDMMLQEVIIPASCRTIGERAFAGCTFLQNLVFEEGSLEYIGEFAFRECLFLGTVDLPDSLVTIDNYAFLMSGVFELKLGSGLKTIGKYAFYGTPLTSLVIPANVETIGEFAFMGAQFLQTLVILGDPNIGLNAFYNCPRLTIYTGSGKNITEFMGGGWNSMYRPVLFNCTFAEEGYLVSVEISADTLHYIQARGGVGAPTRTGYEFLGWATTQGATTAEYELNYISEAASGTTLYAVWQEVPEEEPPAEEGDPSAQSPAE